MEFPEFQDRLQALVESRGLTYNMLANKLDIPPATINRYTKGYRVPKLDNIIKLADFFEVSIDYLLGRDNDNILEHDEDARAVAVKYRHASKRVQDAVKVILDSAAPD